MSGLGLPYDFGGRNCDCEVESPMCSCMRSKQTVQHVLFECKKLKELRRSLWTDEIRKAKWGELRLVDVLTNSANLTKAAKLTKASRLIGYLRAPIEDDKE